METTPQRTMEKPPTTSVGVIGWLHQNLFSSWFNTLLSIVSFAFLYFVGRAVLTWALTDANWAVISSNIKVLVWGRYPDEEAWRLGMSLLITVVMGVLTWWIWRTEDNQRLRQVLIGGWALSPIVVVLFIRGITLPTPATVANNLGYYIYRPELMPILGEAWRATLSLTLMGIIAGITYGSSARRRTRALALLGLLALFGFTLPLGLQFEQSYFGLTLPRLVPHILATVLGLLIGRNIGRSVANVGGVAWLRRGLWIAVLPILILLLTTFDVGVERVAPVEALPIVPPNIWSGMLLTILLSVVSIVASFPIGVLLALGRRSDLPVVKGFSVLFIEIVRGVPLITILFMAQVMLPLFLPLEFNVDRVIRAMAGMTLFTAAYLAEVVRGGLQSVRNEQVEAARALGLSELLVTGLIVLPQALRAVIPPIMGQFVSIFKDTSLVTIVGLLDLLAVGQSVIKQREFLGAVREIYLFAGVFYFVISYAMSLASRRLERQLGVTENQ